MSISTVKRLKRFSFVASQELAPSDPYQGTASCFSKDLPVSNQQLQCGILACQHREHNPAGKPRVFQCTQAHSTKPVTAAAPVLRVLLVSSMLAVTVTVNRKCHWASFLLSSGSFCIQKQPRCNELLDVQRAQRLRQHWKQCCSWRLWLCKLWLMHWIMCGLCTWRQCCAMERPSSLSMMPIRCRCPQMRSGAQPGLHNSSLPGSSWHTWMLVGCPNQAVVCCL